VQKRWYSYQVVWQVVWNAFKRLSAGYLAALKKHFDSGAARRAYRMT
jgi:hypothetical protein